MKRISYIYILLFVSVFSFSSIYAEDTIIKRLDTLCLSMPQINSQYDEYLPYLFEDHMMFTSNRKSVLEDQFLENTEKVYFSNIIDEETWSKPEKNGYKWNSDNNTALVGVDENNFYFYRVYWKNNGEIYAAERKENSEKPWKASKISKLKNICTDYDENSITKIGQDSFLFVSNKKGKYDIYLQVGKKKPTSVDILNSEADEGDLFFIKETNTLYFSSNREGGMGGWDIYQSSYQDNHFSKATLLTDTLVNTEADERDFRKQNDSTYFFSSK